MSASGVDLVDQIWPGLIGADESGPYLVGGRCASCGTVSLGVRDVCACCWSTSGMDAVPIGRTGRLYSATMVHQVPDGFDAPYLAGYVDLSEGMRAFAHIGTGDTRPAIGADVVLQVAPIRKANDGRMLSGPLYVAARPGGGVP
jgi:benzoylsuccinyl-CoA thiolase BbsA subunit